MNDDLDRTRPGSSTIVWLLLGAGAIAAGQVVKNVNGVTDSVTVAGSGVVTVNTAGSTITVGGGGTPSGSFVLGYPNDTTLIGAGFSEIGPARDAWRPTTTTGAPTGGRSDHTAVWTGTKMIVWGGFPFSNTGGQYSILSLYVKN